jgi:uncharacterized membrane protein
MPGMATTHVRRLLLAAILLGIGLGGFFDGIVLHQVLQWHHMLSEPVPPDTMADLELNTLADGLFHAATWIVTLAGVLALLLAGEARGGDGSRRRFAGGMLLGWGAFNLVEGLIDHHLLGLHHVRPGPDALAWDLGFLAWGLAMVGVGWLLVGRTGELALVEGDR